MLDEKKLQAYLSRSKIPAYRFRQIVAAVYQRGVLDYRQMTDIPVALQDELAGQFPPVSLQVQTRQASADDQTQKLALRTADGAIVEIVILHNATGRVSVCISSQIGCAVGCAFCATGRMGFRRDLTAGEIVDQVLVARSMLYAEHGRDKPLPTNVIIMGMGEPFLNYAATLQAIRWLQEKLNIGGRRLTISTAGVVPAIEQFSREGLQVNLAVSLHAATDTLRSELMPINRKYPLAQLREAVQAYMVQTSRKVFFEYIMLSGVNDSNAQAEQLASWLPDELAHVNLIRFNRVEGLSYEPSSDMQVRRFKQILLDNHIPVTVRHSMGDEIAAGCGQLAGRSTV